MFKKGILFYIVLKINIKLTFNFYCKNKKQQLIKQITIYYIDT
jgi:hypothetical protein